MRRSDCRWIAALSTVLLVGATASAEPMEAQEPTAATQAMSRLKADVPNVGVLKEADRITRVYGKPMSAGTGAIDSAEKFIAARAELFGIQADDLAPLAWDEARSNAQQLMYNRQTGDYKFTLVRYAQQKEGIPVFRADLRLLVRNDQNSSLVAAASSLRDLGGFAIDYDVLGVPFDPAFDADTEMTRFTELEPVIWAGYDGPTQRARLAYTFVGENDRTDAGYRKIRFVVDAATGEIVYQVSLILFADVNGNVSGMVTQGPKAEQCSPEVLTPFPYANVSIVGGNSSTTDANGDFTISNGGTSSVTVQSPITGVRFVVSTAAGGMETLSQSVTPPGPADFVHNQANSDELIRAQANGYANANEVRDWAISVHPTYPVISTQTGFSVVVNRTDLYCPGNAWYDGVGLNFCRSSIPSYPNTSFASVSQHEYGHHLVEMGGSGQGAYGEGMSDCISMLVNDDPGLGYGFFYDQCNTPLRNADNTCQYSASGCSSCGSAIHTCGMLLSGSVWDVLEELLVTEPVDYLAIISDLTVNSILMHSGSGIGPDIVIDFLELDDDDGNLGNGTPHFDEICTGFGLHGFSCPELETGLLVSPMTDYVAEGPSGGPFTPASKVYTLENMGPGAISYNVTNGENWLDVTNASGTLFSVGDTAQVTLSINANANGLPSCAYSDTVSFTNLTDGVGNTTRSVTLIVGALTLMDDEFETDQGWTVGDVGDDATTGIWNRADPEGTAAQPENDQTPSPGTDCYVTDSRAGSGLGSWDVDNGKTTLMSPTIDLASVSDATVSYYRWYSNDTGASPNADVFEVDISDDNGGSWTNVETVGPSGTDTSGGWIYHEFQVADFVTLTAQIKMRFIASDEGSGSLVEAGVDDFKIIGFACGSVEETCFDRIQNQGEDRIDCGGPCPACDCLSDGACDDGAFCTGSETCNEYGICLFGGVPCGGSTWCHEDGDACVQYGSGDFEPDGDVDLRDFAAFQVCFDQLGVGGCQAGNFAGDGTIDEGDFASFESALTGP